MSTFQYSQDFTVTEEIKQSFWQQGFVILKNLFSEPEISKLLDFYENSEEIQKHAYGRDDGLNKKTKVEEEKEHSIESKYFLNISLAGLSVELCRGRYRRHGQSE